MPHFIYHEFVNEILTTTCSAAARPRFAEIRLSSMPPPRHGNVTVAAPGYPRARSFSSGVCCAASVDTCERRSLGFSNALPAVVWAALSMLGRFGSGTMHTARGHRPCRWDSLPGVRLARNRPCSTHPVTLGPHPLSPAKVNTVRPERSPRRRIFSTRCDAPVVWHSPAAQSFLFARTRLSLFAHPFAGPRRPFTSGVLNPSPPLASRKAAFTQ